MANDPDNTDKKSDPDIEAIERALTRLTQAGKSPFDWTSRLGEVGRAIEEWRQAIIDDLGGSSNVISTQRIVIDLAAKTFVMIDVLDQYILDPYEQHIIDLERKQAHAVVLQRQKLADSLQRYMKDLGFVKRRGARPIKEILMEVTNEVGEDSIDPEILEAVHRTGADPTTVDEAEAEILGEPENDNENEPENE